MPDLARQLTLLRVYAAFTFPFACVPFLYFYFVENGISILDYGALISSYYVAMVAAEVPTGFVADRYGRVLPCVLGPLLLAAAFVVFGLGSTFATFAIAQALMGVGHSFLSGPPSALLYETLKAHGRDADYLREESRLHAVRLATTGASFLLGGFLVDAFGLRACVFATAPLCAVAGLTALGFRDTTRRRTSRRRPPILASAMRDLRVPAVRWLIAYFVVVFALLRFPFHFYQEYLRAAEFTNPLAIGALFFALNAVAAPFSRMTPNITARLGERTVFWLLPLSLCASLWVMAGRVDALGLSMFFVQQIPFGMHWALVQNFVNHRLRKTSRTTVLSTLSLIARLGFSALLPMTVWLAEERVERIYSIAAVGGLAAIGVCMFIGSGRYLARRPSRAA